MQIAITNIGAIVSGDINNPIIDGNTIVISEGKVAAIGGQELLENYEVQKTIDTGGAIVAPGLIDSHVHPVLGDFTPRQSTLNYIDSSLHGGVTTMISAGEPHTPGRPTDPAGTKALAILVHKSFKNFRPGGVKVHGGAVILEKGLVEKDFDEMAAAGVWLVGEVGLGSVKSPEDAAPMVEWAKKRGMKVAMHTGGTSIPGSSTVTADMVMGINPTVVSHINGGPTAISTEEMDKLIDLTRLPLEIVQCGNPKAADYVVKRLREKGDLDRIIIGNDSPSGTGIIPLGILRTIVQIASISDVAPEKAWAMASGNTAKVYGLETSLIAEGKEADLVIIDAPKGSVGRDALEAIKTGDLPAVAMVIIDGQVKVNVSRNTPPAIKTITINEIL